MKIHGKKIDEPNEDIIIIPRKDKDIILKTRAVLNYQEFNALCKPPIPPKITYPGGKEKQDFGDSKYKKKLEEFGANKTNWMIIKSLQATDGLEFETIDMKRPETWKNIILELENAKFSENEIVKIIETVMNVNGLNLDRIQEARKRFLALHPPQEESQ